MKLHTKCVHNIHEIIAVVASDTCIFHYVYVLRYIANSYFIPRLISK